MKYVLTLVMLMSGHALGREVVSASSIPNSRYRTISKHPAWNMPDQAIVIDADGRILRVELNRDGSFKIHRVIAYELSPPQDFPFGSSIPNDQVLVNLRSLTCQEHGWRLWIAVTLGLGADRSKVQKGIYLPFNFVYVFREGLDGKKTILTMTFPEVISVTVADVNGDGLTEVAVENADGEVTDLDLRQVDAEGNLTPISLKNIYEDPLISSRLSVSLGIPKPGDWGIERSERRPMPDSTILERRRVFRWNSAQKSYELVHEINTQEKLLLDKVFDESSIQEKLH
ncbi:MAG TPA: FG-GAP repeat protein [Terriglobia bacterium]|nr:FG-GAP repeat protein [Terriglobia bacterium]